MKKILLVEDDEFIRDGIGSMLESEGYYVADCGTVQEAKGILKTLLPDMAILDVLLPDGNGYELCSFIRKTMMFPVLFLTCCDDEISTVRGFENGGDDYVAKPFRVRELLMRIQSLLRRSEMGSNQPNQLTYCDIKMDIEKQEVTCSDQIVNLTPNEYKILQTLLRNPSAVVTRQMLLEKIWDVDEAYIDDNTLSVHVSALRRKLKGSGRYLQTVRGMGYRMSKEST